MTSRARLATYRAEVIDPRFQLARQLPSAGYALALTAAAVNVLVGLLPVALAVVTSVLIGDVPGAIEGGTTSDAWRGLVSTFLFATVLSLALQAATPVQSSLGQFVTHRVNGRYFDRVLEVSLRSTGIGPLENEANLSHLHDATAGQSNSRTPGHAAAATLSLVARYTRLAGFCIVVAVEVSWWAGLALLSSTMLFRYGHRSQFRLYMRGWPALAGARRESDYFQTIGLGLGFSKEIRIFGLTGLVAQRFRSSATAAMLPFWNLRRHININRFLWFAAVGLVADSATLALTLHQSAEHQMSLRALTLAIQAAIGAILLGEFYHDADDANAFGMFAASALAEFERDVDEDATQAGQVENQKDAKGLPASSIEFSNVSFRYAGSRTAVLDTANLSLRAGECTAIVGLNGAGKTTLVKLLMRLYEPTAGSILVDGVDVRAYTLASWRRQIAVVFQDFNRYEMSVSDNISLGAIERQADAGRVREAAAKAGIAAAVDALPNGFASILGRQQAGGVELSGGQWQRVAIARAIYALEAGAQVLVLDEPTASLDARAEIAFFQELMARTRGTTSLLISHRFSSVRHADRILVLADGHVIEDGTHETLLAMGGRYAELFQLQAQRFAEGSEPEDSDE